VNIKHRILTLFVLIAVSGSASAQTLYVPASANAEGAEGTRWQTDLQVKAGGVDGATFTVELLQEREDNSDPLSAEFTVAAGQSLRLRALIADVFEFTGSAALRATATRGSILVTSRTFNDDPGGTYGQNVPAFDEDEATAYGTTATLLQLSRSSTLESGFRTNIGFVNVTHQAITLAVELYDAQGTLLGSVNRRLQPYGYRQINDVFAAVDAADVADGYAKVTTTTEAGRFIAYASVVDNRSGDAVFIAGQADDLPTIEQKRLVVFEGFYRDT
jgi:hypothetical protein